MAYRRVCYRFYYSDSETNDPLWLLTTLCGYFTFACMVCFSEPMLLVMKMDPLLWADGM